MTLNDMINTTYSTIKKFKKQAVLTGLAGLMAVTLASCDPNDPNKPTIDDDYTKTDTEQVDDSSDYDNTTVDDSIDETPDEDAIETDDNKVDDDNKPTCDTIYDNNSCFEEETGCNLDDALTAVDDKDHRDEMYNSCLTTCDEHSETMVEGEVKDGCNTIETYDTTRPQIGHMFALGGVSNPGNLRTLEFFLKNFSKDYQFEIINEGVMEGQWELTKKDELLELHDSTSPSLDQVGETDCIKVKVYDSNGEDTYETCDKVDRFDRDLEIKYLDNDEEKTYNLTGINKKTMENLGFTITTNDIDSVNRNWSYILKEEELTEKLTMFNEKLDDEINKHLIEYKLSNSEYLQEMKEFLTVLFNPEYVTEIKVKVRDPTGSGYEY